MRDGYLRGALSRQATQRQMDVLAAYVALGSVADAAEVMSIRPSTAKRHLADLRARMGFSTEQLSTADEPRGGWQCRASRRFGIPRSLPARLLP